MPEISRFFGIIIRMYYREHGDPHFHAEYGEHKAVINIETLAMMSGNLPPRAYALVAEWALLHKSELRKEWERARNQEKLEKIAPLE